MKSLYSKLALGAFILLAGTYSYISLHGPQGLPRLMEKRQQIQQLQEQNERLERENAERRQRLEDLKNSESQQELELRTRLKVAKPNETTFILPKTKKPE